jgi:ubiquinone/menaquinone biosynthesis C-methylase UbiE
MYGEFAYIYDLIYNFLDYKKTAKLVKKLIKKHKKVKGNKLLDVGCGTGKHLSFLKNGFECTGIDISNEMLDVAREKYNGIRFLQANMVNFNLNEKFDVVICLFSSIGYVKTYENLNKTIINFSNHLEPGGVVIIEPWLTKSVAIDGLASMDIYKSDEIKIARQSVSEIDGDISRFEMHYLVARKGEKVSYFKDMHELGLFEVDKTLEMMKDAGLDAIYLKKGLETRRGLFIGIKQ